MSRARRCIENAFGVLSGRFRVLRSPIAVDAAKTRKIVLAACALHNFLITENKGMYTPPTYVDHYSNDGTLIVGSWRRELQENTFYPLERSDYRYISQTANEVREEFADYFLSIDGEVEWQYRQI